MAGVPGRLEWVRAAFGQLPPTAAWRHVDAREGFEVAFLQTGDGGYRLDGCTTAVEDGQAWLVGYESLCR
jgi:uncharacterized protein